MYLSVLSALTLHAVIIALGSSCTCLLLQFTRPSFWNYSNSECRKCGFAAKTDMSNVVKCVLKVFGLPAHTWLCVHSWASRHSQFQFGKHNHKWTGKQWWIIMMSKQWQSSCWQTLQAQDNLTSNTGRKSPKSKMWYTLHCCNWKAQLTENKHLRGRTTPEDFQDKKQEQHG